MAAIEQKVDFFVQTQTPPLKGVFYDGQLWDARALVLKLIASAKRSLILIDNWATSEVLDLFAKKREGVKVTIFTSAANASASQRWIPAKYAASRKPLSRPRHNLSGRACRGHIGGRAALPRPLTWKAAFQAAGWRGLRSRLVPGGEITVRNALAS